MTGHISLDDYDSKQKPINSCPEIGKLVGGFNPFEKRESSQAGVKMQSP